MTTETLLQIAIIPLLGWTLKTLYAISGRIGSIESRIQRIEMHLDPKVEIFPAEKQKTKAKL